MFDLPWWAWGALVLALVLVAFFIGRKPDEARKIRDDGVAEAKTIGQKIAGLFKRKSS